MLGDIGGNVGQVQVVQIGCDLDVCCEVCFSYGWFQLFVVLGIVVVEIQIYFVVVFGFFKLVFVYFDLQEQMYVVVYEFDYFGVGGLIDRFDGFVVFVQYDVFVVGVGDIDDLIDVGIVIFFFFSGFGFYCQLIGNFFVQVQCQFFMGDFGGNYVYGQVGDLIFWIKLWVCGYFGGQLVYQIVVVIVFFG